MTTWQRVWRDGFAPVISRSGLLALRKALKHDDRRIAQGATTTPPTIANICDCPVEAACALGYCGWQVEGGCETVGQVEEYFERICFEADQRLGEPAGCRWFLNWYDETPRPDMIRSLLDEVELELQTRRAARRTKRIRQHSIRQYQDLAIAS
jgi:hypothetical protein